MPYKIKIKGGKYCVIVRDTGKTKKCYDNEADAQAYNSALNMAHKGLLRSQKNKKG